MFRMPNSKCLCKDLGYDTRSQRTVKHDVDVGVSLFCKGRLKIATWNLGRQYNAKRRKKEIEEFSLFEKPGRYKREQN
jgi:hypothetical protein